jgi:hypothetical protein
MIEVTRYDNDRCSYKCHYYQDGSVASYCNKYHKYLRYDGHIPPLLTEECKKEIIEKGEK